MKAILLAMLLVGAGAAALAAPPAAACTVSLDDPRRDGRLRVTRDEGLENNCDSKPGSDMVKPTSDVAAAPRFGAVLE